MGHASSVDAQARFRAELRRSGVLRNSLALAIVRLPMEHLRDSFEAWLRARAAAKEARSRPRSSAG